MGWKNDAGHPRSEVVRFRASVEQREAIRKAAAALGMTVSAFLLFAAGEVAGEKIGDLIAKGGTKRKD